jgi:aldehyde dehydrogenase (NAD+)
MRVANNIRVGAMWINCYRRMHWAVPFGGVKNSGYGRGGGWEGIRSFQYSKGVWLDFA